MKKFFSVAIVLLLCVSMILPVLAEDLFVPSISYKDGPLVERAILHENGEESDVTDCVVVTSITAAKEKTTDITQEERDLLLEVYEKLSDGSMKVDGLTDEYVIRELVDVSFGYENCRQVASHSDKDEKLDEKDITLEALFDLGVGKMTEVVVMTYIDGKWEEIVSVENNGDGTVTCMFEDLCPVIFAVKNNMDTTMPETGDAMGQALPLWFAVMGISAVAIFVLVASRRKVQK